MSKKDNDEYILQRDPTRGLKFVCEECSQTASTDYIVEIQLREQEAADQAVKRFAIQAKEQIRSVAVSRLNAMMSYPEIEDCINEILKEELREK